MSTVGLVFKIAGNKCMLLLVAGALPWIVDFDLFSFELPVSRLLRLLTLAIKDLAMAF